MEILSLIAVLILGTQATEIAIFNECTLCHVAAKMIPASLDIDDYGETLCPGEELVHVPGTTDCKLVTGGVPR